MIIFRPLDQVRAVSFDLDDTLYDNGPILRRAEDALLEFIHTEFPQLKDSNEVFWQRIKAKCLKERPELTHDMGAWRQHTLRTGLLELGMAFTEVSEATDRAFEYFYYERSRFKVDETICSLLARIADKLPMVAITNGNVDLDAIGIGQYFEQSFHANLEQPKKPDPAMFELASRHLAMPNERILHVGDGLINDIAGAHEAGFQTAWYAGNRHMGIGYEPARHLPNVQLANLDELALLLDL
ncbi:5-amino-6-(5-phospho-D-ribitylamino)uracil phosphatase YigB [Saliniradius amylolyticus]|uniref:5-amino-6-(5-phospho-D-ribitylamino)uracil phosphatase YigB n=1 Tax=Saliniradius amylolyticus TaxID=2183582 RepID=A0A2S2E6T9_9ALTE|nr:HAD-IA family hydrolase [Saliniradius amylolyticus]AWL13368.1 5-amino-6-(5-phospho-D-ribitylamino)uracil phosphatase YigB [Saliniradius amylolyticus]